MNKFFAAYKNFLPVIVLSMLLFITLIRVSTSNYSYLPTYTVSFVSLLFAIVSYFYFRRYYKYIVAIFIAIGMFGFATVTIQYTTLGLMGLEIQLIFLVVAILFIALNFAQFRSKFVRQRQMVNTADTPDRERVDDYKRRYMKLSDQELQNLSKDTRFVEEANLAASELLSERQKMNRG